MTGEEKKRLAAAACRVRMGVIESTHGAKAGHPGGSLSSAELFAYLYNKELRIDPENPKWNGRDPFELENDSANVEGLRRKFLGELRWFTDMIDTLRVEDTLYKKAKNV